MGQFKHIQPPRCSQTNYNHVNNIFEISRHLYLHQMLYQIFEIVQAIDHARTISGMLSLEEPMHPQSDELDLFIFI